MAKPRIFLSSTYYDLKYIRSSLDAFFETLGFESILSEKGDIAYSPDNPLDESCYREVVAADIFVLIIGGRYGSAASGESKQPTADFFERYDSVTKKEFQAAVEQDIPVYILVEAPVFAEYSTFQKNKHHTDITYAHVDSINVFHLIDDILRHRRNNPVKTFERTSEIKSWLRDQWSGLFKDFLTKRTQQQQISSLSTKVEELGEVNSTLKRYIEAIITKLSPDESSQLIDEERKRLQLVRNESQLAKNNLVSFLTSTFIFDGANVYQPQLTELRKPIEEAKSLRDFYERLVSFGFEEITVSLLQLSQNASLEDLNDAREILRLPKIGIEQPNQD